MVRAKPLGVGVPQHWSSVRCACIEAVLSTAILAQRHADVWDAAALLLREHWRSGLLFSFLSSRSPFLANLLVTASPSLLNPDCELEGCQVGERHSRCFAPEGAWDVWIDKHFTANHALSLSALEVVK